MIEKLIIGKHETPTVPIKRFAKDFLERQEIESNLRKAVIEFVEANYWIENKIGDPEIHGQRAMRKAKGFGLSDQQLDQVRQTAQAIYLNYKSIGELSQDKPLTRSEIVKIEALRRQKLPGQEARRKKDLKNKLEQRFKRLTVYSDDELRTLNSNQRINLNNDPIYKEAGIKLRREIKRRGLTAQKYQNAQDKQSRAHEKSEDPYEHVAEILTLSKSNSSESIRKLVKFLISDDEMIRQAAVDALDSKRWKPKTMAELTFYLIAKGDWEKVIVLGDDAITGVVSCLLNSNDVFVREKARDVLDKLEWKPENTTPEEAAAYYAIKGQWGALEKLGENEILSIAPQVLARGDSSSRRAIAYILEKKDTPQALRILAKFKNDEDVGILHVAKNAVARLTENPFYLQKITGVLGGVKIPIVRAILSVHPEWENKSVSKDEIDTFSKAISYLPPVGGKLPVIEGKVSNSPYGHEILNPSMVVEEQIRTLAEKRQRGQLREAYIHQLTVQGRLPDEFKYVALALILSSPYSNDWSKPFFEAPWGTVAPMIHDGGNVQTNLNPYWKNVEGRTDFLQRVVLVHEPKLEELEKLTPEEKSKYSVNTLANARVEQEERDRLITEAKAYQRLALALHAKKGTAPEAIPEQIKMDLAFNWEQFKQGMDVLLGEYEIKGPAKATWFNEKPQDLVGWPKLRYEAEWSPIQKELIVLEQSRSRHPELQSRVRHILDKSVDIIDRTIGLLPN